MHKVFSKVPLVWEEQLKDIERARHSIHLEQYILKDLSDGGIGRKFIDALIRKRSEGVVVSCILDAQGSFELFQNKKLNDQLSKSGVKILYYKTLGVSNIISPLRFILRDHRKLLIVDKEISWIGGVVIGEEFREWDDLMVRFTSTLIANTLYKEFCDQFLRLQEKKSLLAPVQTINSKYHIIGNAPGLGNRFCYEEIRHALMRAQKSVMLVTPYFVPPIGLERIIMRRLSEGLSITLLVPRKSDKKLADLARESFMKKMIAKGLVLKYSEYMIHAKIVITDNAWMSFGSTNLDVLSLILNHELNMVTRDHTLIESVENIVNEWTDGSPTITFPMCEYQNQSRFERLTGRFFRYIV